jgi:hypothetical protein
MEMLGHEKLRHEKPGHEKPGHEKPGHEKPGHEKPGHEKPGRNQTTDAETLVPSGKSLTLGLYRGFRSGVNCPMVLDRAKVQEFYKPVTFFPLLHPNRGKYEGKLRPEPRRLLRTEADQRALWAPP